MIPDSSFLLLICKEIVLGELTYLRADSMCRVSIWSPDMSGSDSLLCHLGPQAHMLSMEVASFAEAWWAVPGPPWALPTWTQLCPCVNPPTLCCILGFVLLSLWPRYELCIVLWLRLRCVLWLNWKVNNLSLNFTKMHNSFLQLFDTQTDAVNVLAWKKNTTYS